MLSSNRLEADGQIKNSLNESYSNFYVKFIVFSSIQCSQFWVIGQNIVFFLSDCKILISSISWEVGGGWGVANFPLAQPIFLKLPRNVFGSSEANGWIDTRNSVDVFKVFAHSYYPKKTCIFNWRCLDMLSHT